MNDEERAPDGRTKSEILEKVLSQPETKAIAESLGLDVKDYAEMVAHFALHPEDEPEIQTIDEGQAKAAGVPTLEETQAWLQKVADGEVDLTPEEERTRFAEDDPEADAITLTGAKRIVRAPKSSEGPKGPAPAGPKPARGLKK